MSSNTSISFLFLSDVTRFGKPSNLSLPTTYTTTEAAAMCVLFHLLFISTHNPIQTQVRHLRNIVTGIARRRNPWTDRKKTQSNMLLRFCIVLFMFPISYTEFLKEFNNISREFNSWIEFSAGFLCYLKFWRENLLFYVCYWYANHVKAI